MIISLGDFIFKAHNIKNVQEQTQAHFDTFKPIASNPHYHNTQGVVNKRVIQGVYIADSNSKPAIIQEITKEKKPVRLTLASGESVKVIITDFTTDKKNFLPWSGAVNIDFQIKVIEIEDKFSIGGVLYGILQNLR